MMLRPIAVAFTALMLSAQGQMFPDCEIGPLSGNPVCNTSLSPSVRAEGLISNLTLAEKIVLLQNRSPGVARVRLPSYNWCGEALHGVAGAPGVNFSDSGNFSYATAFPQPITMAAAFDDGLILSVGEVISTEARARSNANRSGLDFWTPNINPFRDPRWGRGQETPGEDTYVVKQYIKNMVAGLQGGTQPDTYKIIATCKHYAAYYMEFWQGNNRYGFNAVVGTQDMTEYYLQPFQECARDTKVGSIMCSYNAINGVPACADDYLIGTVLRGHWNWTEEHNYITSDCTAIQNMFSDHYAFDTRQLTVAAAKNAGVDVDCGYYYPTYLPSAHDRGLFNESAVARSLNRLYSALVRVGYFDPASSTPYRSLTWNNVSTPDHEALALKTAEEGIVLLKNDGTLPLKLSENRNMTILMVGGWLNATTQMQGTYTGGARILVSPWEALQNVSGVQTEVVQWYESPLLRAQQIDPDLILVIDAISEGAQETEDRNTIAWSGLQIDAIEMLATYGKPVVLAHMGEQCDDSVLLSNPNVSSILWAGYPGMLGGQALINIMTGQAAPAARMPLTQVPAEYVRQVPFTDMALRPNSSSGNPGRTYKWYSNATIDFGYGLHYSNFSTKPIGPQNASFDIQSLVSSCDQSTLTHVDLCPFLPTNTSQSSLEVNVTNIGSVTSDFVVLTFVSGNFGPEPQPLKSLVAYQRLFNITGGSSLIAALNVTLGALARRNENGDEILYPGQYRMLIDVPTQATWDFQLTGEQYVLDRWPQQ